MNDEMSLWAELMNSDDFNDLRNRVLFGDCRELLDTINARSVNLVMTSPPYAERRNHTYGGIPAHEYVDWFIPIADKLKRVLSPDGSFVLNIKEHTENGERHTYVLELILALKKSGWLWIDDYIWVKTNPMPGRFKNRFKDAWEHCLHFTLTDRIKMNKDAVKVPSGMSEHVRKLTIQQAHRGVRIYSCNGSGFQRLGQNMIKETVDSSNCLHLSSEPKNHGHSAVFPVALPEFFITLFSDPEDLVLDPFAGSGTTLVAAKKNFRQYIGIEINSEYEPVIRGRLNKTSKSLQHDLFKKNPVLMQDGGKGVSTNTNE